jgi:hypothetical protein
MKAYLIVTSGIFALIGVAHLLRLFIEGHSWSDPWFLGSNLSLFLAGGGIALWAMRLLASLAAAR